MADKDKAAMIIEGLTKGLEQYGEIMGEKTKLQGQVLSNQIKAEQNWFYKMKEKDYQSPYQKQLGESFKQQQTGGGAPAADPFSAQVQPQIRQGETGYKTHYPPQKEFIYNQIQKKKQRGMQLSQKEKAYEENYLGTAEKEPSWKQQATIDAIKSDLKRKSGTTYSLMGEPQPFEMKNEEAALDYISQRGFSPELFKEELTGFRELSIVQEGRITVQDAQGNTFSLPSEQLGEAIKQGYKQVQ